MLMGTKKRLRSVRQFHNIFIRNTVLPVICLAAFLCAGCQSRQGSGQEAESRNVPKITSMETTPVVDYAVPKMYPNILVDSAGYRAEGSKRAAVKGKRLPDNFRLVDAVTKETVFTGQLEDVRYNTEQGIYSAYADFYEWEQEGSYYLECGYVGRSYTFLLEQGLYDRLFGEVCQELEAACRDQTVQFSDLNRMLLAYEWYAEAFEDDDANGTADILEEVADWIVATDEMDVPEDNTAAYAAVLAKFSYLYQKYDRNFATDCLKRASVVFDQSQSRLNQDAENFQALTELYRATGLYTYRKQIEGYKTYFQSHPDFTDVNGYLYGAMTYLNTRQKVDVELCTIFMNALMEQGETVSGAYEEMIHPVTAHNNGAQDLLGHAMELACANYIMNNHQYNRIMEEFLHYLRGRNALSVDFYATDTGVRSEYLIMLAQLVTVQENLK